MTSSCDEASKKYYSCESKQFLSSILICSNGSHFQVYGQSKGEHCTISLGL